MAISLVQQSQALTNTGTSSQAVAFTGNTTTGNLIIVSVGSTTTTNGTVSSITDSQSNVYTKAIGQIVFSNTNFLEIWYAKNITGGTTPTVTATFTNATPRPNMTISEYSGIDTVSPLDATVQNFSNTGTAASTGASAFTVQADELIFVATNFGSNTTTATAGSGYGNLLQQNGSTTGRGAIEDRIVAATGTQTGTFTLSTSGVWLISLATFKAVGTGPVVPVTFTQAPTVMVTR